MNRIIEFASMVITLGVLSSCQSKPGFYTRPEAADDGFKADIATLRNRHIYFGHQSVGKNIMDGLSELLQESGESHFAIADLDENQSLTSGGIAHARIGQNRVPEGKCAAFARFLEGTEHPVSLDGQGAAAPYDLAVMKFCYLDVDAQTDVVGLFAYFMATMITVQARNPSLVILYVTVPLKAEAHGRLSGIQRLLGFPNHTDADNIRRAEFNTLLRMTVVGKPIFDLAALESTYPDGTRASFQSGGETGYRLIDAMSSDGGHLNDLGRRMAAKAFVHAMARALGGDRALVAK